MGDLRVELNAKPGFVAMRHTGDRAALGLCNQLKVQRELGYLVPVAHPNIEQLLSAVIGTIGQFSKKAAFSRAPNLCVAEL